MLQPEVSFPSNSSSMLQQERFFSSQSWASLCFRAPHNLTSVCLQGLFSGHSCPKLNTKSTDLLMLRFPWLSSNWPLCCDAPPDSSLTNISLHENLPWPWFWWWSHLCCPTALHDHVTVRHLLTGILSLLHSRPNGEKTTSLSHHSQAQDYASINKNWWVD